MRPISCLASVGVLIVVAACGGDPAPQVSGPNTDTPRIDSATVGSPTGRLYVLTGTTMQRSELVTTFDITCDATRTQVMQRDSIRLWSNGDAVYVATGRTMRNGVVTEDTRSELRGTWRTYTTTEYGFYDQAPGIVLTLRLSASTAYQQWLRRSGVAGFSQRKALGGGRCSPSTVNATTDPQRDEEWFYEPR